MSPADPLLPLLDLPGVAEAADRARADLDRLLAHRVLRRRSAEVTAESALRGARASAALSGAAYPLATVRAGDVTDPVVLGALRVSAGLGVLVPTWPRAPLQVLARLHVLAAAGLVPEEALGRPAGSDPAVNARLGALGAVLSSRAPAAVRAAVVHAELLVLAPFGTADALVARAAYRLTLITAGLDPKAVSVPEVGHLELGTSAYDEALAGYRAGGATGVGGWLQHCCTAIGLGAREGLAVCEAIVRG